MPLHKRNVHRRPACAYCTPRLAYKSHEFIRAIPRQASIDSRCSMQVHHTSPGIGSGTSDCEHHKAEAWIWTWPHCGHNEDDVDSEGWSSFKSRPESCQGYQICGHKCIPHVAQWVRGPHLYEAIQPIGNRLQGSRFSL